MPALLTLQSQRQKAPVSLWVSWSPLTMLLSGDLAAFTSLMRLIKKILATNWVLRGLHQTLYWTTINLNGASPNSEPGVEDAENS